MSFVHLHVHSSYSVLDGFGKPSDLVERAKALGMPALALTDHGTMFGTLDFYKAAKAAGVKPIIGLETYVAARSMYDKDVQHDKKSYHLILLAENMRGYQNLLQIASVSQLEGFYWHPRIDHDYLAAHAEGLIGASACISGEIPRAILENDMGKAERLLSWYQNVFGRDNFFLELQDHDMPELNMVNRGLMDLAKKSKARMIATNDVHYPRREDAELQDILLAVQTGRLLSDKTRMSMNNDTYYLRSPEEMRYLFTNVPEALSNTLEIAERCNVDLARTEYHLPKFEVPVAFTPASYLRKLCLEGLEKRMPGQNDTSQANARLDYELGVIHKMGFDEYFLIVWDLCRYAKEKNIWYNARGSAAGSLVAYGLYITSVEPLSHKLFFERFLNPDRITMPDIDLDFQDDRRADIMEYCNLKYGADKVAAIITFGTLAARGAIRDVGRVMDIPLSEVNRVTKMIPDAVQGKAPSIADTLQRSVELKTLHDSSEIMAKLIDTASRMEGAIRNIGTHAAGVIISDRPITEYLPLHRPTSQNEDLPIKSVAQYDMAGINDLGLLKVDFLGLVTLTIMAKACAFIEQRSGKAYTLDTIPTDDPEVYKYISEGHTVGLFQLEGNGMTRYIMQMEPSDLSHVIAMIALYRPGPMESIPEFIEQMHGQKEVTYQHEKLIPILKDTYGHAVYQEQVMQAAIELAGYSASESDDLRSAISKKKPKEIKKHHKKFVEGAVKNGLSREEAEAIFANWEGFAHYGFNKSHAADYGVIAVQTAYLKLRYPVEYMTALLSAWKNDTDKCAKYVAECRAMGIDVLPPDVNTGSYDFVIEDRQDGSAAIRFGLGAIKNVGQNPVDMIIAARKQRPFADINDFIRRVDLRQVGKRPLECLIKVGALDSLGKRHSLLRAIEQMVSISASHFRAIELGQLTLFSGGGESGSVLQLVPVSVTNPNEGLEWEKELLGLYISDNPLSNYMKLINAQISHLSNALEEVEGRSLIVVGGVVKKMRPYITKNNQEMAFATIEDNFGDMELVIFPSVWEKSSSLVSLGALLVVTGRIDHKPNGDSILVDEVKRVETGGLLDVSQDQHNQGPYYNQILEKNLPDLAVLSRYANGSQSEALANDMLVDEAFSDDYLEEPEWEAEEFSYTESMDGYHTHTSDEELSPELDAPESTQQSEVHADSAELGLEIKPSPTQETEAALADENKVADSHESPEEINELPSRQRLVITINPYGEHDQDWRRIKRVHGWLSSHPGDTHFSICIPDKDRTVELDFPNDTTDPNEDLIEEIMRFVGGKCWRIDQEE